MPWSTAHGVCYKGGRHTPSTVIVKLGSMETPRYGNAAASDTQLLHVHTTSIAVISTTIHISTTTHKQS